MSRPIESGGKSAEQRSWKNNRRASHKSPPNRSEVQIVPNNEILHPEPGMLFIGQDLVKSSFDKEIILAPEGCARITVPLNTQWKEMFMAMDRGEMKGGIHLRSNAAQAQMDIQGWKFAQDEEGEKNYDALEVTLVNHSSDEAFIESNKPFKLGNPYCYQSSLEGNDLQKFAAQIGYANGEDSKKPVVVSKEDIMQRNFEFTDESIVLNGSVIEIPLTKKHPNIVLHKRINLTALPSGTDRDPLHEQIAIHSEGKKNTSSISIHEPTIQLTSTPSFSMAGGKALLLKACLKEVDDRKFLIPHSASAVHRSEVVEVGSSPYKPGETYTHAVIIESYNYVHSGIYPTSVLCEAFNMRII